MWEGILGLGVWLAWSRQRVITECERRNNEDSVQLEKQTGG